MREPAARNPHATRPRLWGSVRWQTNACVVGRFEIALMAMSFEQSLVDRHIEAIVERRAEQRPDGVAKLARVGGIFIGVERLAIAPGGEESGVALRLLDRFHYVVAQVAFAFAGGLRHGLGGRQSLLEARWEYVEMQMHVDGVRAGWGL